MKTLLMLCAVLAGSAATATVAAQANCPPYVKHDPGGDYTNPDDRAGLAVVEQYHFSRDVDTLKQGMTGSLGGDISYTLEHFPNHHRALAAMAKLGLRDKRVQPVGARYTVSCYFERAIAYAPHDTTARMIFGNYLLATRQDAAALEQMQEAARREPQHATLQYNLGLLYVKRKDYAQAREHAAKAYGLGFPLQGLKNQLKKAGQWQEPPAQAKDAEDSATAQ